MCADILWHNSLSNETQIWSMSRQQILRRDTVVDEQNRNIFVGLPWSIVGTQLTGHVVWHNSSSKQTQIWFMEGHQILDRKTVVDDLNNPAIAGPPWDLAGSHSREIVWHNSSTNETHIWFMDGHRIRRRDTVVDEQNRPVLVGPPWGIVAIGDLRRDGIVWHNSASHETQIWFIDNHQIGRRETVVDEQNNPVLVGPPWEIVASHDREIVWHNTISNETQIWIMNGHRIFERDTLVDEQDNPIIVGPPWNIVGADDFRPQVVMTTRIAQVSGKCDPEGLFHYQDTNQWGIDGIDLGASTVHDGRTYIFFGDVPGANRNDGPPTNADAIGVIDDVRIPAHTNVVAAKQGGSQSDAFFIGNNGELYVSWVRGSGNWFHPLQISGPDLAPPGACLAAAHQLDDQLDVLFIGNDGGLHVAWVVGDGVWQGPVLIGRTDIAKPGGRLVAANRDRNRLSVFFIGSDRRLYMARVVGRGNWDGPNIVGDGLIPYPEAGTGVAACMQENDQLDVFFIGQDGGFYVAWSNDDIHWQGPLRVSPNGARVSVPGANLAAFSQTNDQVTVAFVDGVGRLNSMWVIGRDHWQGPAPAIPAGHAAPPGTPVTVEWQRAGQWDAFLVNDQGAIEVYWVIDREGWQGPVQITPPSITRNDAAVAAVRQLDNQLTVISAGRNGELQINWVRDTDPWQGPVVINPEMMDVRFLTAGPYFRPFTIKGTETDPNKEWMPLGDGTPTGAFSHGEKIYVFAVNTENDRTTSYLVSSDSPDDPKPYNLVFPFSQSGETGYFFQVAPVVVRSSDFPGLESPDGEGVMLFGHGTLSGTPVRPDCIAAKGPSGVNLAFMPFVDGEPSKGRMVYWAGQRGWQPDERSTVSLFSTCYYWTSLSAGRIVGLNKWILLYQLSGPREIAQAHHLPIVARIADTPWGMQSAEEIVIFDPQREQAWGRYMFRPNSPYSECTGPGIGHPAFVYGAYLLHKYTQWDAAHRRLTIFYLMSTGFPYQAQLMRSTIQL